MAGFKSQTKRNREAAKLAKRQAKDQKRALRKAERAGNDVALQAVTPTPPRPVVVRGTAALDKPLTLAEAVERWKRTKVAKPQRS
jgi:hypothetical protein